MVTESTPLFRPYAPPANMQAFLHRIRRMNMPPRVTREILRGIGISENIVPRVLSTLRFLELITDGDEPTDILRGLAGSTEDEYRQLLERTIRTAYADDFEIIDPGRDPQEVIMNAFQKYTPARSTRGRSCFSWVSAGRLDLQRWMCPEDERCGAGRSKAGELLAAVRPSDLHKTRRPLALRPAAGQSPGGRRCLSQPSSLASPWKMLPTCARTTSGTCGMPSVRCSSGALSGYIRPFSRSTRTPKSSRRMKNSSKCPKLMDESNLYPALDLSVVKGDPK